MKLVQMMIVDEELIPIGGDTIAYGVLDDGKLSFGFSTWDPDQNITDLNIFLSDEQREEIKGSDSNNITVVIKAVKKAGGDRVYQFAPSRFVSLGDGEPGDPLWLNWTKLASTSGQYDITVIDVFPCNTHPQLCDYLIEKLGVEKFELIVDNGVNIPSFNNWSAGTESVETLKNSVEEVYTGVRKSFTEFLDTSYIKALEYIQRSVDDINGLEVGELPHIISKIEKTASYGPAVTAVSFNEYVTLTHAELKTVRELIRTELEKLHLTWDKWTIAQNIYSILAMVVRTVSTTKNSVLQSIKNGEEMKHVFDVNGEYEVDRVNWEIRMSLDPMTHACVEGFLDGIDIIVDFNKDNSDIFNAESLAILNKALIQKYELQEDAESYYDDEGYSLAYNEYKDCRFGLMALFKVFKNDLSLQIEINKDILDKIESSERFKNCLELANYSTIERDNKLFIALRPGDTHSFNLASAAKLIMNLIKIDKNKKGGR